jgi:hypothetical protein
MAPPAAAAAAAPAVRRARSVAAPGRPLTTAPRPRRVSGPARRQRPRVEPRRSAQAEGGLALGALAALRSVERNPLLDRLLRGRTWIALVAFALIGIVTLQLGLLKLNAGIGRTLEREALLQRENSALSIENSEFAAGDRVETSAARLGMEIVPIGSLRSLTPHPGIDASRAAAALSTPARVTSTTETSTASSAVSSTAGTEQSASSTAAQQPGEGSSTASTSSSSGEPAPAGGASSTEAPSSNTNTQPSSTSAPTAGAAGSPAGSTGSSPSGEATPAGGTQAGPAG